jgi:hypothetical protein
MSRVDERIRKELQGLGRPVRTDVFDCVEERKRRRRVVHRVGASALTAIVIVGTSLGGYGLLEVFAPADRSSAGAGHVSASTGGVGEAGTYACDLSVADTADIDANGLSDLVEVYSPVPLVTGEPLAPEGVVCADPVVGEHYSIRVQFRAEDPLPEIQQNLPECGQPFACRLFATPDLDGDGRAEIAVVIDEGASTLVWTVYRLDLSDPEHPTLVRLEVAEPGDPWDPIYGLAAGPATFTWYGSVTHQQWVSCDAADHQPTFVTALRSERDPGVYFVHGTQLRLVGSELHVGSSWDDEVPEHDLEVPTTVCGAELLPAG